MMLRTSWLDARQQHSSVAIESIPSGGEGRGCHDVEVTLRVGLFGGSLPIQDQKVLT